MRADVGGFFRTMRGALGGKPLPYVWVPEWHKTGHGLHVHFAVGRYVRRAVIDDAWGHGFVHITLLGDLPVGAGSLDEARRAARYLSKYVGKTFTDSDARVPGLHRYDVAQGFKPQPVPVAGRSSDEVLSVASELMGSQPARVWLSSQEDRWDGPPAIWAQWSG